MAANKFIIDLESGPIKQLTDRLRGIVDNDTISLAARKKFVGQVQRMMKKGKAFDLKLKPATAEKSNRLLMTFIVSEKLQGLIDEMEAA